MELICYRQQKNVESKSNQRLVLDRPKGPDKRSGEIDDPGFSIPSNRGSALIRCYARLYENVAIY